MEKECTTCKQVKNLSEYHDSPLSKDGKNTQCRDCINKKNRARYQTSPEERKRKADDKKRYLQINRAFVYDYLSTHSCIDCGEVDPVVLEFDHIANKIAPVSEMITRVGLTKLKEEINKCEVRCANCHRRKTAKDFNYFTHRE